MTRKTCCFVVLLSLTAGAWAGGLGADAAYRLDTSQVLYGPYDPTSYTSLDGTWVHYWSDRWDGTGIGEGTAGGVTAMGGYLRLQDPGDPRDYGVNDAISNRKFYFAHEISQHGASDTVLDEGVTLFFRMRLATGGLLDPVNVNGGDNLQEVPATGDGYLIHDSGKGMVGIKQAAGGIISFSLAVAGDDGQTVSGLVMNSLNGTSPSSGVDSGEGTANVIELDPTVWHDFWVTIQAAPAGPGTHRVTINVDGGPTQVFSVTAGTGNDYAGVGFIGLGAGATNPSCAYDLAALEFTPGVLWTRAVTPAPGAGDVERGCVLSWTPSEAGRPSNVYLGDDYDAVLAAEEGSPLQIGAAIDGNSLAVGPLSFGETLNWRVDPVGAGGPKGRVWSFTVEPVATTIASDQITATASSQSPDMAGPEATIDGSGLNDLDQHDTSEAHMWASDPDQQGPVWIQYAFDHVVKLHQMLVWNSNTALEFLDGWGVQTAVIETSLDGQSWTALPDVPPFAQAPGTADYQADTTVNFNGTAARFVKLTLTSNFSGTTKIGLSEVRFLAVPAQARSPQPRDGATAVALNATLRWRAGRGATEHAVYLGTDPNALVLIGTPTAPHFSPADLPLGSEVFWRVDEVNSAAGTAGWTGPVWRFATVDSLVLDDFEAYTDASPQRVFQTWLDGLGFSADDFFPDGRAGNGTGAIVGYDPLTGSILERLIVHGGQRSMPLSFTGLSETTRSLEPPQDWTAHGITTLVIHFHGTAGNTGQLYAKINGTRVPYPGSPDDLAAEDWITWSIDLAATGASLTDVTSLGLGVDGSDAAGLIFVDDILLQ